MDWMQANRLSVWQFLPTGPTGFGHSPYQPLSVFAGNPLLIDIDALVEWGLLRRSEAARSVAPNEGFVNYDRVAALKFPLLSLAAERFDQLNDGSLISQFEAFCAANDDVWLDNYAAFILLKAENGSRAWPEWLTGDRHHHREAIVGLASRYEAEFRRAKLVQFFFTERWRVLRAEAARRGIVLFGDVPIYMALDCAEAWARPELLELDDAFQPLEVAGVPPDYFSAEGQRWGSPIYRWERHAADGYAWWIARLRHALDGVDLVRLDHFRGFDEYWSVPVTATTARDGRWNPGPGKALFDALLVAFGRAPFVAEDLGIITESVVALRKAYALPGMQVLQFLVDQFDFDAAAISEDCVCYTGTHDNDTAEGWFAGSAGHFGGAALEVFRAAVLRNVEGAEESVHKSMIKLCFSTRARIAIAPLQDFLGLGSEARLNTPGTSEGNWRWRARDAELDGGDFGFIGQHVDATGRS
jgi:4-alpha-glucanotransferase